MRKYTLPDLPYDFAALEPHISGTIMELHHDRHHRNYVLGANEALEKLAEARAKNDFTRLPSLERSLAFNLSGHVLHSIFWRNLSPDGGGRPTGDFAEALDRFFGGFEAFQRELTTAAMTIMGSGWAALSWDPVGGRLVTTQIHDHQSEITQGGIPLLVVDAWEHAYYLQYYNEKARYFAALWNLWNWEDIAARYASARSVDLELEQVIEASP
jgi:Fe-Mn family superoxide dismutase